MLECFRPSAIGLGRARSRACGAGRSGSFKSQMLRKRTGWPWSWSLIGALVLVPFVGPPLEPVGRAQDFFIVLNEDAVVDDGDSCGLEQIAGIVEMRGRRKATSNDCHSPGGLEALKIGGYWP